MARDGQAGRSRRGTVTDRAPLRVALGVELDDELLVLALTHRSYAYEHGGLPTNERLEFLGDAVLSIVVTERLYRDHPELPEGQLAKLRASVVNMHALAGVAATLSPSGLGAYIYLGRGEELTGGRTKTSILADATEALIGAIYLEHGLETARDVIHRHFATLLRNAPLLGAGLDWKTSLQELTAAQELGVPEYRIAEEGPDHLKTFTATALVGGRELGSGAGRTKKEAEQKAAEIAWRTLTAEANGSGSGSGNGPAAGSAAGSPTGAADAATNGRVDRRVDPQVGEAADGAETTGGTADASGPSNGGSSAASPAPPPSGDPPDEGGPAAASA